MELIGEIHYLHMVFVINSFYTHYLNSVVFRIGSSTTLPTVFGHSMPAHRTAAVSFVDPQAESPARSCLYKYILWQIVYHTQYSQVLRVANLRSAVVPFLGPRFVRIFIENS